MRCQILTFLALLAAMSPAFPYDEDVLRVRLNSFENAKLVCKATLLANKDAASSFILSNSGTLGDQCECAAILAVSGRTDTQLREILTSSDLAPAADFAADVNRRFLQCVQMR